MFSSTRRLLSFFLPHLNSIGSVNNLSHLCILPRFFTFNFLFTLFSPLKLIKLFIYTSHSCPPSFFFYLHSCFSIPSISPRSHSLIGVQSALLLLINYLSCSLPFLTLLSFPLSGPAVYPSFKTSHTIIHHTYSTISFKVILLQYSHQQTTTN